MNDLMKELMAEAERVQNLETEAWSAVTNLNNEVCKARKDKLEDICKFLYELNECFRKACPGETFAVNTSGNYKNGNHTWTNYLQFGKDMVWLGIWMSGAQSFSSNSPVYAGMITYSRSCQHYCETFVDEWTDRTKQFTENEVAKAIRNVLAKRIEKSTTDLKKANEKHEEYFRK